MKMFKNAIVAFTATIAVTLGATALEGDVKAPKKMDWSFKGPFGQFDKQSAQRGFQVVREVCASCHSMKYFRFRNLAEIGFPADQIKAIAAEYEVEGDIDDAGDPTVRKGEPKDPMPAAFPNENAARASNGGAYPPDLSLITKSRVSGPDYLYSLLTGYSEAPADFKVSPGMNYNPYFKGSQIAMAAPLSDDIVEYQDGTKATVEQMAKDVTMFLAYVGEPKLEDRHSLGLSVLIYLAIFTLLAYLSMKKIWAPVKRGENVFADKE